MRRSFRTALLAGLLVSNGTAHGEPAAAPSRHALPSVVIMPMRPVIVRADLPGCGSSCPRWISAEGTITTETPAAFRDLFQDIGDTRLPILLRSSGGVIDAALEIGRMLRARQMTVAVTGTRFIGCRPADDTCRPTASDGGGAVYAGMPITTGSACTSACAYLLAGGTARHVSRRGQVGVHRVSTSQFVTVRRYHMADGRKVTEDRPALRRIADTQAATAIDDRIARYLAEMGVSDLPLKRANEVPATSVRWLTRADLVESRLATDTTDGADLVLPPGNGAPLTP